MDKLQDKKEYWKKRKLYRVLKDDSVSCYFFITLLLFHYIVSFYLVFTKNIYLLSYPVVTYFCKSNQITLSNHWKIEQLQTMKNICNG